MSTDPWDLPSEDEDDREDVTLFKLDAYAAESERRLTWVFGAAMALEEDEHGL